MSLIKELLEKPPNLSTASKYTVMNGVIYLATGALFIAWPGVIQTLFMDAAFVGHERSALACDWPNASGHRLALFVRWPIRRAASCRRFGGRPIGVRSCGTFALGCCGRVPSFARGVSDSRPIARHRCMDTSRPKNVMVPISTITFPRNFSFAGAFV